MLCVRRLQKTDYRLNIFPSVPNIAQILPLTDMEAPDSLESFRELYMMSPLYDKDLSRIVASNVPLTDEHHKYFVYQILCALKYLHG